MCKVGVLREQLSEDYSRHPFLYVEAFAKRYFVIFPFPVFRNLFHLKDMSKARNRDGVMTHLASGNPMKLELSRHQELRETWSPFLTFKFFTSHTDLNDHIKGTTL